MTSSALIQIIRVQRELIEILNKQLLSEIKTMNANKSNEKSLEILELKEQLNKMMAERVTYELKGRNEARAER